MDPITPGIISNLITQAASVTGQRFFGGQIKITMPRAHELMSEPKALGSGFSYVVRGKLSRLPKGHKIWLLTKDENTGRVWPQSFEDARYYEETKIGKAESTEAEKAGSPSLQWWLPRRRRIISDIFRDSAN
jgi:hypothetical protein